MDPAADSPVFVWRVHLAATHKSRSMVVGCASGCFAVAIAILYESLFYGAFALVVLFGSAAGYWTPRRYMAYPDRLEIHYFKPMKPVRYEWSRFRICSGRGDRVLLSAGGQPSGLRRYRELRVMLPEDGDEIERWMIEKVAEQGE